MSRKDGAVDNAYTYDANGNMVTRNGVATDWFSYNLPQRIRKSANTWSDFSYNHSRERWKQQTSVNGAVETTTYIGQLFEKRVVGADTEYRHLIVGGNGPVAYVERTAGSTSTTSTYYVSTDHLAGTSVITNETGAVLVSESFDAFGQRRGSNWTGVPSAGEMTQIATTTRRGFTFHEHLDNVNLIHMNGRVFDPQLGRFTSADPFVQAPYNTQSLNRYSYTFNNPLTLTDPSGFNGECFSWSFDPGGGSPDSPDGGGGSFLSFNYCPADNYGTGYVGAPATTAEWTHPGADSMVGRIGRFLFPNIAAFGDRGVPGSARDFYLGYEKAGLNAVQHLLRLNPMFLNLPSYEFTIEDQELAGAAAFDVVTAVAGARSAGARGAAKQGTGAFLRGAQGGAGLGKLAEASVRVSEKGLAIVEKHLAQFDEVPQNTAMISRLRAALARGEAISGADAVFYTHELAESTMMARGISYETAHAGALQKYGVSPFSVYHPDVIQQFPWMFNSNWRRFWNLD